MNRKLYRRGEGRRMNHIVFYPDDYRDLPLIVYLHGAGERGGNIEHIFRHGLPLLLSEGREYPAVILCPQCPEWFVWNNVVEDVKAIIDETVEEFGILKDRIAIAGSSMGGFGTWEMGLTYSSFFSAIAPVAGGGLSWRCSNLVTTPVWAFHGTVDGCVPPVYSQMMVDGVNGKGGNARLTLAEGLGHAEMIDEAFRNTELMDWLMAQRRTDFTRVKECLEEWF